MFCTRATGMSLLSLLQECYRGRRLRLHCCRCHHFKTFTTGTASGMLPPSQFLHFQMGVAASRMLPPSPLQDYYRRPFKDVSAVNVPTVLPLSSLQECYGCHCFKKVTAVAAPRMAPLSRVEGCNCSHRFNIVSAIAASRVLPLSPFLHSYRCHRFKNVTAVTAPRMLPLSPFQEFLQLPMCFHCKYQKKYFLGGRDPACRC